MAVEHIKKWRIGDVEVARIAEIYGFQDHIWMLLKDADAEYVKQFAWLRPHFATPEGLMILSFQCFVLRSQGKNVMIDTCIGADRKREYDVFCNLKTTFLQDLEAAGYPAHSITTVMCTHLHFDHVGWNTHLVNGNWVPTFPNARYLFGKKEYDHWVHLRNTGGYHDFEHMVDAIDPVIAAGLVDFIGPEHRITDEVSLFPTPGHTPGHVSVLIRSRGEEAVITGDMLHHPIQFIDPQRHGNFDMDKDQGARTRQAFVDRFADTNTLIIGSHFADPTSGWLVRDGKAWKLRTE
ncbi:MAG TPA: MBL fold metallo-hydrolase [Steroidobacteraceae bacterium]|jgi:glyoxylase-like metal-dependent hydrolase (beta-lactamase superfamily II)|nr:MBL fold metallo-hydrolase [Steroidobacteraceae bacterium]